MVNSQTGRGGLDTIKRREQTRDGYSSPLKRAKKDCGPKNRVTVCMVSYELNELKKNFESLGENAVLNLFLLVARDVVLDAIVWVEEIADGSIVV